MRHDWHLEVSDRLTLNTKSCQAAEEAAKVITKLIRKLSKSNY